MRLMRGIRVGESVERNARGSPREGVGNAGRFPDKDRIPAVEKLPVRQIDAERDAQAREIVIVADRPYLMAAACLVHGETGAQERHVAACVFGPSFKDAVEVDVDHDIAEIEQQRVGEHHRSAAAMLPPSTVVTSAVVFRARACARNACATSSAVTSRCSRLPRMYSASETPRARARCLMKSSVTMPERTRSALTAFERMPSAP